MAPGTSILDKDWVRLSVAVTPTVWHVLSLRDITSLVTTRSIADAPASYDAAFISMESPSTVKAHRVCASRCVAQRGQLLYWKH